jgi:hypothetical protein
MQGGRTNKTKTQSYSGRRVWEMPVIHSTCHPVYCVNMPNLAIEQFKLGLNWRIKDLLLYCFQKLQSNLSWSVEKSIIKGK